MHAPIESNKNKIDIENLLTFLSRFSGIYWHSMYWQFTFMFDMLWKIVFWHWQKETCFRIPWFQFQNINEISKKSSSYSHSFINFLEASVLLILISLQVITFAFPIGYIDIIYITEGKWFHSIGSIMFPVLLSA